MPSGELVATLLDGMVTGNARHLPVNLPNDGNVTNLADGAVVEIMGVAERGGVHGRDRTTCPASWASTCGASTSRRSGPSKPRSTGNRTLVLEAMLADAMATQIAYDDVVAMTDEMLAATARWLPQFR